MRVGIFLLGMAALLLVGCSQETPEKGQPAMQGDEVVVYRAASVITMDAIRPRADAVAVDGDRIVAVGNMLDIQRSLEGRQYRINEQFKDQFLLPGFIDPHLHPYLSGILLPMEFITPHDWDLPGKKALGVRGRDAYLNRLREHESDLGRGEWLWTWGYHPLFHGDIARADLDEISADRPMVVWHRSFHEIYLNSAALKALKIDEKIARQHHQVDYDRGHFFENGMYLPLPAMMPRLFEPERYVGALRHARKIIHAGGITTVADGAFGTLDVNQELEAIFAAGWDTRLTPFRTFLLLDGKTHGAKRGHEEVRKMVDFMPRRDRGNVRFQADQIKLFADGAAYSQLMQMSEPYLDGHEGEWLMEPQELEDAARVYWNAGFQIHVHVNGDKGLDVTMDILQKLQEENPREDHRFTVHHMAYARPDQARRLADLGGLVQANPYYLWALADKYADIGLGQRRASQMVPMNSFVRTGMRVGFHSDFPMAPSRPLLLAWAAATRITAEGNVFAMNERLTVREALRGITIDAAFQIGKEADCGSIEVGKMADFTVLEQDPFEVPAESLKDIPIWGTVFEGKLFPLEQ